MTGWDLPEWVEVCGTDYRIHADYRDILDIIARLNAPDQEEQTQLYVVLALFYQEFKEMPPKDYPAALERLFWFLNGGQEEQGARPRPKTVDWEQDRALIIADLNRVAGCEVRALPFCHWWTFLAWFNGIGEGQLSTVVSIREKRRKGKKLEDWEKEFYQEHREMVDFQKKYTAQELEEQTRLNKLLGE